MRSFDVLTPSNILELVQALKKATANSKILSGGTDLVIALHERRIEPDLIIDMSGMRELDYINEDNDNIYIGAITTFTQITESQLLNKYAACLVQASETVGSRQIRNRGTIGGNIGNCSPAGDTLPVLMVLEAAATILNSQGNTREMPIGDILKGPNRTALNYDEVIIGVKFPKGKGNWISSFAKLGSRTAVTIAKINVVLNADYDADTKTIRSARVGLGAVGKTAFRALRIEEMLKGQKVSDQLTERLSEELSKEIENAIPGRASLPYKKEAIKGVAHEAFEKLLNSI
ncbi:FAD binding domain-containing protein [Lutispora saccharofermentans]|uniref:FAD binding domain-containing protein n=1 Tax=Lutispora saccharofermentans TaxID=3024236 RepID=A0ABT1NCT0_9FIRM|nr:FAD binding domain-containing protein [Lutispora saccharofermentans]MCQ1528849.1 FAD binding domain-containing protein [Lutispora saccharofermentans]